MGGPSLRTSWKIAEIQHKYLFAYRDLAENFNRRFPGHPGFWRMVMRDNDVSEILEVVKRQGEARDRAFEVYKDRQLPISFITAIGGGNVVSFAQTLRRTGRHIRTCVGLEAERVQALSRIEAHRGSGAVLDTLTLWAVVGIGAIDVLKAVFARVAVPRSTLDDLAVLRSGHLPDADDQSGTLSYSDGAIRFDEHTADSLEARSRAISNRESAILNELEIVPVEAPDDVPMNVTLLIAAGGPNALDAPLAAQRHGMMLISDDGNYRMAANWSLQVDSAWLQAVFLYARDEGLVTPERYARLAAGLARLGHGHLALDGGTLANIHRLEFEGGIAAAAEFIGTEKADIYSHIAVTRDFLRTIWVPGSISIAVAASTGTILRSLLRFRSNDWAEVLALIAASLGDNEPFQEYLRSWVRGHFLSWVPITDSLETLANQAAA